VRLVGLLEGLPTFVFLIAIAPACSFLLENDLATRVNVAILRSGLAFGRL